MTYLLRGHIEAAIPGLVAKFRPNARDGMKQADRDEGLREIAAKLAALHEERERLSTDLGSMRAALAGDFAE